MVFNKNSFKYCILGSVSLVLGLSVYVVFRPGTYVARFIFGTFCKCCVADIFGVLNNNFIKFHFADFLWAFSFACFLHAIFEPALIGSLLCAALTGTFGMVYECLQYFDVVGGTGDLIDCLIYMIAGVVVVAMGLILKGGRKK